MTPDGISSIISSMLDSKIKQVLEDLAGPDNFSSRPEDLIMYAYDGTNQSFPPDAVIWPGDVSQVAALVRLANEYKFPVIPRGSGSGLSGGALPVRGGVVCVMTRFNRILEIDAANLLARVQPGLITAKFQEAVEKQGLFYPPDPASREFSTLGGNAAENAGGTRAVKYGVTRDYILGLEAVIGTGEIVETGVITPKGVVGYDLTRLLVGSEGTLGIITRLNLRLLPRPEARATLLALFDRLSDAARTVAEITRARIIPATLEFMDRASLDCVRDQAGLELDIEAGALLLIETDGPEAQAAAEAGAIEGLCLANGALAVKQARTQDEADRMWAARRAISPALYKTAPGKINEDIVVPRSRIPEMVDAIEAVASRRGLNIINFGHAGDGNIHVNIMYDPESGEEVRAAKAAAEDIFSATLNMGGTISGEHGIGTSKAPYIEMEIKPEALSLMKRLKAAFDPEGILNPGKIFP